MNLSNCSASLTSTFYVNYDSVAIQDDVILIGGPSVSNGDNDPGQVYIFNRNTLTGDWDEGQKLRASDEHNNDEFGFVTAIDGDQMIIGAPRNDHPTNSGSAYIFEYSSGSWIENQKLVADDAAGYDYLLFNLATDTRKSYP